MTKTITVTINLHVDTEEVSEINGMICEMEQSLLTLTHDMITHHEVLSVKTHDDNDDEQNWIEVPDENVRTVWKDEDRGEIVTFDPTFFIDNGTPIDDLGDDMTYLRTEVKV